MTAAEILTPRTLLFQRVKAHVALYEAQFARPGNEDHILADGPTDFMLFSTGRRAVAYLQTVFNLFPRQDILQAAYEFGWSMVDLEYSRDDVVTLDFKLSAESAPAFIFGVVSKYHIKQTRKERFDLVCTSFVPKPLDVDQPHVTSRLTSPKPPRAPCCHPTLASCPSMLTSRNSFSSHLREPNSSRSFRTLLSTDTSGLSSCVFSHYAPSENITSPHTHAL